MKTGTYILAIDQGTTGSRAILYDSSGRTKASAYAEFRQHYPKPGWVEHDAAEIIKSVKQVIGGALHKARVSSGKIHAIGITNQRETTVLWNRLSGEPIGHAIVWQDRRTESICRQLKADGLEPEFRKKTGLCLDPYFSGTKLKWRFDHDASLRHRARDGQVLFGTMDSWLLFHLTGKRTHATDFTNASRTLLFDLKRKKWDLQLAKILHVPAVVLPEPKPSAGRFGVTKRFSPLPDGIPIYSLVGDQQAALFGQSCYRPGESKNTYGTGCFLLMNLGSRLIHSRYGLLTTIACDEKGNPAYALEGAIFIGGAAVQWLRDGLRVIQHSSETESMALKADRASEVVVVPAFTGLGAPYWRPDVRGAIFGLTRGSTREDIVKATLDSVAFQVREIFDCFKKESGIRLPILKVDGGASQNRYLMQLQADLLGVPVWQTSMSESTAWGAAKLAGLASGFWPHLTKVDQNIRYVRFVPRMSPRHVRLLMNRWQSAVRKLTA